MRISVNRIGKHKPSALQGRLDFSPVAQLSFRGEHSIERIALRTVCAALIGLTCMYLYFVTASVLHVMARREALATIDAVQGSIGNLEQQYFTLSEGLTPLMGEALGLSSTMKTSYVHRPGTIGAATMARNEI